LKAEYNVTVAFDRLPYNIARWVEGENLDLDRFELSGRCLCVLDVEARPLVLFDSEWMLRSVMQDSPNVNFVAAVQPGRSARSQV
jgi:peptide chain release factor 3